jgi:hypothetical protein
MAKATRRYRAAWEDRFNEPTWDDLCAGFSSELQQLCEELRRHILDVRGLKEQVRWCGLPWRWSLTFLSSKRDELAWAYLVPNPETPAVGLPLAADLAEAIAGDADSRRLRDAVSDAKRTNGCVWLNYPVSSRDELEDVLIVVNRKHEFEQA